MAGTSPAMTVSDQILFCDDFTEPAVVRNEFLDEFMHAVLENIIHVAVIEAIADTAGVALGCALAAIGDADLVEIAHQIAVTAGQRTRQRVVENQKICDQPWLEGFPINPVLGGQRRDRAARTSRRRCAAWSGRPSRRTAARFPARTAETSPVLRGFWCLCPRPPEGRSRRR